MAMKRVTARGAVRGAEVVVVKGGVGAEAATKGVADVAAATKEVVVATNNLAAVTLPKSAAVNPCSDPVNWTV